MNKKCYKAPMAKFHELRFTLLSDPSTDPNANARRTSKPVDGEIDY